MSENPPNQDKQSAALEQARSAMQTHRAHLLSLPNVVGLGVGFRQQAGEWTESVALIVMVKQKLPLEALSAEERIPPELDGVPVDVQETGIFYSPG